jgi:hypothetical protein
MHRDLHFDGTLALLKHSIHICEHNESSEEQLSGTRPSETLPNWIAVKKGAEVGTADVQSMLQLVERETISFLLR